MSNPVQVAGAPNLRDAGGYLRSNDFILPEYHPLIEKYTAAGVDKDILLAILGVRREYLEASFNEMHDKFGGIEEYFERGLGIDAGGQAALRTTFVHHDTH